MTATIIAIMAAYLLVGLWVARQLRPPGGEPDDFAIWVGATWIITLGPLLVLRLLQHLFEMWRGK